MKLITGTKRVIAIFAAILMFPHLADTEAAIKAANVKVGKPAGMTISVDKNNNVKISWKTVKNAAKYEVYCATKKDAKYKKIKTVSKCSYKISNQKVGKKYYYKVRAYRMKSGKKVYGAFSAVKSVTLPKIAVTQTPVPTPIHNPNEDSNNIPITQTSTPVPTPTPVYTPIEDINKNPIVLQKSMFFTVVEISENSLQLSCETNLSSKCYTLEKPDDLNVQKGTRLKIVNPQIASAAEDDINLKITGYTRIVKLEEGVWTPPMYVKQISDETLYLLDDLSNDWVGATLDLQANEILVMKNGQFATIEDIKVGDKLIFYVSSPMTMGVPPHILDCTKICIIDE